MPKKLFIKVNENQEMMSIDDIDCNSKFHGNFWDFDSSAEGLKTFFESVGIEVELTYDLPDV